MDTQLQRELAQRFKALHEGSDILVVGSAWDAGSAVVFEREGLQAIATSSAGVAFSLGYADGEILPLDEHLRVLAAVVRATRIPVSADIETGYGRTPAEVSANCRRVLETGVIGINIEDTSGDARQPLLKPELQAEKIRAIRAMAEEFGVPLFINARTDNYWLKLGDEETRFQDTVARLNLYRAAGADGLFVPGVVDGATIRRLVQAVKGPLNILASAGAPPVPELAAMGVRRLSQGSGPARAALSAVRRIARDLQGQGTYTGYTENTISYAETNRLFEA